MSGPTDVHRAELWNLICGDELGSGMSRTVYEHRLDGRLVVKAEVNMDESFQNVSEWQAWQSVRHTEHARWFAPCVAISQCGRVLIQRRTTAAANHPERIPNFLTDTKLSNYGILIPMDDEPGGQFVCHDYGMHLLHELGMSRRTRKAPWGNER